MAVKGSGATTSKRPRPRSDDESRGGQDEVTFFDLYEEPNWDVSELDFSSEEWVVPATDSKGHSVRETVRIPPIMHRAIEILIASKRFPYKTPGDFIRHHIYRGLFFCHRRQADVPRHILSVCEAIITQMRDEQQLMTMRAAIEQTVKTIAQHATDGNVPMVRQLIAQIHSMLEQIDKNSAWKKRFKKEFLEKCAGYYTMLRQTTEEAGISRPNPYSLAGLPKPPADDPDQLDYD